MRIAGETSVQQKLHTYSGVPFLSIKPPMETLGIQGNTENKFLCEIFRF